MYCSKCGANVAEGVGFCSACGQPVVGFSVGQAAAAPAAAAGAPAYAPPAQAEWQSPAARAVAYAGFWLRFVAWIIDRIVVQLAVAILAIPFGISVGMRQFLRNRPASSPEDFSPMFANFQKLFLLVLVLTWLYYALLESSPWQGTLGKKALGLEVTDMAGNRISFGRATGRYFGRYVSWIILGIGFLMAGFTAKKQALHDLMAGALVIRKL
ncbi:MAG: RDD family protein [Candidatus Acidiferrales bacterium]